MGCGGGRTYITYTKTTDVREKRSKREERSDEKEDDEWGGPGWYSIVAHTRFIFSLESPGQGAADYIREIRVCFELFDSFCS